MLDYGNTNGLRNCHNYCINGTISILRYLHLSRFICLCVRPACSLLALVLSSGVDHSTSWVVLHSTIIYRAADRPTEKAWMQQRHRSKESVWERVSYHNREIIVFLFSPGSCYIFIIKKNFFFYWPQQPSVNGDDTDESRGSKHKQ